MQDDIARRDAYTETLEQNSERQNYVNDNSKIWNLCKS